MFKIIIKVSKRQSTGVLGKQSYALFLKFGFSLVLFTAEMLPNCSDDAGDYHKSNKDKKNS
jgi:hypothetical protein